MIIIRFMVGVVILLSVSYSQIMVVSQNKVVFSSVKDYNELSEKYWQPIFDKLVDEGKLDEWGSLNHYWGDEWNVVAYYKAKDIASFEESWTEGYALFKESTPQNVRTKIQKMIVEHKDSIYQLKHSHSK
tara:strand:+ start:148 stop:537 length:390 start_codon:yes stop_codon:yes gene_type:complete